METISERTVIEPAQVEEASKRRLPDRLRSTMIRMQGNKMYLPAAYRVVWFRDEMPNSDEWGIVTEIVEGGHADGYATVKASIVNPAGRVIATAHKTEEKKDFPAGWVEKAESGAVSRALSLLGFGTQFDENLVDKESLSDSPKAVAQSAPKPAAKPAVNGTHPAPKPAPPVEQTPSEFLTLEEVKHQLVMETRRLGVTGEGAVKRLIGAVWKEKEGVSIATLSDADWREALRRSQATTKVTL